LSISDPERAFATSGSNIVTVRPLTLADDGSDIVTVTANTLSGAVAGCEVCLHSSTSTRPASGFRSGASMLRRSLAQSSQVVL
jgi:hypothetical protein